MPIVRDDDPNIGCLALPISALAGFIVAALVGAAVGASAGVATIAGLVGAFLAALVAVWVLRRSGRSKEDAHSPW